MILFLNSFFYLFISQPTVITLWSVRYALERERAIVVFYSGKTNKNLNIKKRGEKKKGKRNKMTYHAEMVVGQRETK